MHHCRTKRTPYLIEATVSRLHGHSSSSGAARVNELDCIAVFESKLMRNGVMERDEIARVHDEAAAEVDEALEQVLREPMPAPEDVERFTYHPSPVDSVYPGDYTGLPR
jgi:2-oxoisovalerate dehydrogenase E1 component alpha subunit